VSFGKKVHIVKASRLLQAKVGYGKINPRKIEACQKRMDTLCRTIDFSPVLTEYLEKLESCIATIEAEQTESQALRENLTNIVMQLKANAGMFGHELLSQLAATMLTFVETVKRIDRDVLDILRAHQQTILVILKMTAQDRHLYANRIHGELVNACNRYYARHPETELTTCYENDDAYYIDL